MWSGGLPTGAITDLATTDEIVLLPLDAYVPKLNERYGEAYQEAEVEKGEYPGVPPVKTIAVPNLLMVRADMDETLAHDVIELMFDHKKELAEVHPSAEKLELEDAQKIVAGVELHPGAERYYQRGGGGAVRTAARASRSRSRWSPAAAALLAPRSWRAIATAAWSPRPRCPPPGASS